MTAQLEIIKIMLDKIKIREDIWKNPRLFRVIDAQFTKCMEETEMLIR